MEENKDTSHQQRKIYRSKAERVVGGVCGGIAEYFAIDPLIIRITWVFITLFAGAGLIAYIAALIIIPDNPEQEYIKKEKKSNGDSAKLWGTILIIIGTIFLMRETGLFYYFHFWTFPWQGILAALLIGFGIYILINRNKPKDEHDSGADPEDPIRKNNFYRVNEGKMLAGVCTGLSYYFDLDVTLIRLLWVFGTLASGGLGILAYIIAIIVFPEASGEHNHQHAGGEK
jgi:phage shock protein PspC (stress-responsive transcriptional regulator)